MLDANARVGSIESLAIGTAGAEIENIAGQHFHQWLHDSALFFRKPLKPFIKVTISHGLTAPEAHQDWTSLLSMPLCEQMQSSHTSLLLT